MASWVGAFRENAGLSMVTHLYQSLIESTIRARIATTQLNDHRYEELRTEQAHTGKRWLSPR
jgi:hypothetical protein